MPGAATDPPPMPAPTPTVAEIRVRAVDTVKRETRGATTLSLIGAANAQMLAGKEHESNGDAASALSSYVKTATLVLQAMESDEYKQKHMAKGASVIRKEIADFLEGPGKDLTSRTKEVTEKLKAMEQLRPTSNGERREAPRSIADRVRLLQDNGLAVGTTRIVDPPTLPTPPTSPRTALPSPPSISPSASTSAPPVHAIVHPSALGPPSPSSTPSSSPPNPAPDHGIDLAGFAQAFPSIDELDSNLANISISSASSASKPISMPAPASPYPTRPILNGDAPSPITPFKNFAVPIERPSSTPITPTGHSFNSRPSSPTRPAYRPSGLSNGASSSPRSSSKIPIQKKNAAEPRELLAYLRDHEVLLIDVRNRDDFEREHIKAKAVVCIEPSILVREGMTAEGIENAMTVGPTQEAMLFKNRDKFDLVVVYDATSTSFGSPTAPLDILVSLISERAFRKYLKRMPMILVGGIEAWKHEFGGTDVVKGSSFMEIQRPTPTKDFASSLISSPSASANGVAVNHTGSAGGSEHQIWTPKHRPEDLPLNDSGYGMDAHHSRSPADAIYSGNYGVGSTPLMRRPAMTRPGSGSMSFTRSHNDGLPPSSLSQVPPITSPSLYSTTPISYPTFPKPPAAASSASTSASINASANTNPYYDTLTSPPVASLNPFIGRRRGNDFVDQSQEALSALNSRPTIEYPELISPTIIRPPPVAAPETNNHHRPRLTQTGTGNAGGTGALVAPKPPRIPSDFPVTYWPDISVGLSGLKNLGNTCYMNAPIQCLSATVPFARFFIEGRWKSAVNCANPLGSKGRLTGAFAKLVHEMWSDEFPYLTPIEFRRTLCHLKAQYNGTEQHDSQEFLSFLIDGIHEDLNRIISRPVYNPTPEEEAELERLSPQIASEREWKNWKTRNDSLIVDYFQGQFRNHLQCLTCSKTSTTYNVFSILQLPIPHVRSGKVSIDRCLRAFFDQEILEKDDAWDCPKCKAKRRATKTLSLARLPPVLMIHFKRFEANGRLTDKVDTFVDFPMKGLDLTNYMPPPLPPGVDTSELNGGMPMSLEDPRTQQPPYRYDLYAVTNHYGNLSSGHYTSSIASKGAWFYCDDSSIKAIDPKQVVSQRAYVLFYKRVRT